MYAFRVCSTEYNCKFRLKKYIHSCLGYYVKENIKVLSILAKRKKAKLITHEHGVTNIVNYVAIDPSDINFYKGLNTIIYQDIYFAWGTAKLGDHWNNVEKNYKILKGTRETNLGRIRTLRVRNFLSFF